ncbi:hypothetical protein HXX76_009469 [Chlamydomonas incerta]|uniref:Glycosyl transferase CAP10 domain-containing protein n=1 Tax=Chlamydomonas incerta TaxID=51695 RepID=A0A835SQQ9_CHLIN|nr:hypothetical protein HXX76_009469 [Chlamydomonas incerta]|eukprot:KAG2431454.1 hypothetical protein HXX76_009469 [Chlamydomonas incerta]
MHTQESFYRWTAAGVKFPNSVFLLDLENGGSCRVEEECPAPVFSIFDVLKQPENFPNFEFRIQSGKGSIMLPDMSHPATTQLVTRPWNEKTRKAIFRGSLHCPVMFINRVCPCSRAHFTDMVKKPKPEHGDAPQFIDLDSWDERDQMTDDMRIQDWPHEYSKFMFMLALDGQSGSMKLEEMLHINSVILKEHSPVVEFFERVIKPNEHYVPILLNNSYDALDIIKSMQESEMQRIANNAQQFAQRYLCDEAKKFYFLRALEEYNSLFADMESYIRDVILPLMAVKEHLGLGHHYQNLPKPDVFEP